MIKVDKKMFERFLEIMEDYGEFIFGSDKEVQRQLEICLNSQGYWSGCSIRLYYSPEFKDFIIENRY